MPKLIHSHTTHTCLYRTDTSVKRTLGSVPLVSVLLFDCIGINNFLLSRDYKIVSQGGYSIFVPKPFKKAGPKSVFLFEFRRRESYWFHSRIVEWSKYASAFQKRHTLLAFARRWRFSRALVYVTRLILILSGKRNYPLSTLNFWIAYFQMLLVLCTNSVPPHVNVVEKYTK